jgi:hypothetical protein
MAFWMRWNRFSKDNNDIIRLVNSHTELRKQEPSQPMKIKKKELPEINRITA